jgi:hypothetical protein
LKESKHAKEEIYRKCFYNDCFSGLLLCSSAGGLFWNLWGPSSTFLAGTVVGIIGMIFCFNVIKGAGSQKAGI